MPEEDPALPPDPALLNRQPAWFKPVFYGAIIASVLFVLFGLSTKGNPARIIAFGPVIPGTTKFDPKPFEGKAVALRIDNSVASFTIHKDGHIYHDGINLLSPTHPMVAANHGLQRGEPAGRLASACVGVADWEALAGASPKTMARSRQKSGMSLGAPS